MANFSKILKDQKKDFASEKKKVQISEAAQEFVLKQQVDKGYTPSALKDKGIGRGAQKIVKDFETAVFGISDVSGYADFADFVRQWQTTVAETKNSKRFSAPEQVYIQDVVGEAITQISSLGGVALRSTFAAETFLKQFKPMKLLQMLTKNVPILNEMVDRRISSVEAGETTAKRAVLEGKREKKRERLAGVESKLGGGDFGGDLDAGPVKSKAGKGAALGGDLDAGPVKSKAGKGAALEEVMDMPKRKKAPREQLATKLTKGLVGKASGEEKEKEAETEREETQDLFQKIADNTDSMVEILGGEGSGKKKKGEGGFFKKLLGGDFLKTLTGGLIGGTAGAAMLGSLKGMGAKFVKTLGSKMFLGITGIVSGLFLMIMDGFKGSKLFGGVSGFIGGFLGGVDKGIKGAFKNMGKWALLGAGVGSIVPGVGTMIGGLIGALIGGVLGFIGGEKIARAAQELGENIKEIYESIKQSFKDIGAKIWNWLKALPALYLKYLKVIFSPITWLIKKMVGVIKSVVNFVVDKIPDFGIDRIIALKEKMKFDESDDGIKKPDMKLEDLKSLDMRTVDEAKDVGSNLIKDSSSLATTEAYKIPPMILTDNKTIMDNKQTSYVITGESVLNTNEFKALRL